MADVHFGLASLGMGNPQEALRASQEAVQLYQELGNKQQQAISLHILANAACFEVKERIALLEAC